MTVDRVVDVWKRFRSGGAGDLPDAELLRRFIATQDEAAFEGLVRRHGPMVWGVCQRMLAQCQDAEDAFQTTFLVLSRRAGDIGRRELLANWLFGVARRAAAALRRSRGRRALYEFVCGEVPDVRHIPPELWSELSEVLDEEIARLPGKYRSPLLLCCLQGRSHAQAAETLGWPVGTVAGRLSRGRELLRTRLQRRGVELSAAVLSGVLADDVLAAVPPALLATSVTSGVAFARTGGTAVFLSGPVAVATHSLLRQATWGRATSYVIALGLLAAACGSLGVLLSRALATREERAQANVVHQAQPSAIHLNSRYIRLPADPEAVVLELDVTDQTPTKPSSLVSIHADGRVSALITQHKAGVPETTRLEHRLSRDDVQELMQFVVHDQELFDFETTRVLDALQAEYEFDGTIKDANNTSTTTIRVKTAEREHEIVLGKLGSAAVFFAESRRIRQLVAVDTRMRNLLNVMRAGGPEHVNYIAHLVNQKLALDYPAEANFTAVDLWSAAPMTNAAGTRYVFQRGYKYGGLRYFSVFFDVPEVGEPRVVQVTPIPSTTAPTLPRRMEYVPRCFEEDLNG